MVSQLLDAILEQTYIQVEALSRLRTLKDLILVELFGTKERAKLSNEPAAAQHTGWLTTLNQDFFKKFTRENVYDTFNQLEKEIKKIQPLIIYFPFEVTHKDFTPVGQYLRKTYGKNFLAEIKVDPTLIAGTAFVWKGIYKDYSIRKKISENREEILTSLKSFIRH